MAKTTRSSPQPGGPVFRTGLHPASCAGAWTLAGFVLFIGTLIVRHNELAGSTDARILGGSLALAAAALVGPLLRLRRSELVLTPSHLRVHLQTWRERVVEVPLREIREIEVNSSLVGRRLDFGTVMVVRADGDVVAVSHVHRATALRDALRRLGGFR
jgi:hypothetical protein